MTDTITSKILYVGNLDQSVSEDLLRVLFSQIGDIRGCKVIRESHCREHAFRRMRTSVAKRERSFRGDAKAIPEAKPRKERTWPRQGLGSPRNHRACYTGLLRTGGTRGNGTILNEKIRRKCKIKMSNITFRLEKIDFEF
ncbi:uncharacterized protein LOC143186205 [Calliopsis andreniformis]|uniref:uncharacterized protein LOC143186205 n=1 Tax=Calliopsis andreniformis TaxID=337506 RepID=UPI003FCEC0AE